MAHVKTTLDMRREKADGTYNIIYRITHLKRVYTVNSGYSIPSVAWRKNKACVVNSHGSSKCLLAPLSNVLDGTLEPLRFELTFKCLTTRYT